MKTLLLTPIVLLLTSFTSAQEPSLKPKSAPKPEAPAMLSLEVDFKNSLPPAYISVRGAETKPRWIWGARFARIPGAKPDPDPLPVQAIRVESQFNGETADVKVSLLRGRNGFELPRVARIAPRHLQNLARPPAVAASVSTTLYCIHHSTLINIRAALRNTVPPCF